MGQMQVGAPLATAPRNDFQLRDWQPNGSDAVVISRARPRRLGATDVVSRNSGMMQRIESYMSCSTTAALVAAPPGYYPRRKDHLPRALRVVNDFPYNGTSRTACIPLDQAPIFSERLASRQTWVVSHEQALYEVLLNFGDDSILAS